MLGEGVVNQYLPLLGILIVILGFALRLNPMLVVPVAALATGLRRRCRGGQRDRRPQSIRG